jgi:hypothetical protein
MTGSNPQESREKRVDPCIGTKKYRWLYKMFR